MAQTTAEKLWTGGEVKASREMLLEFLRGKFGEVPQNIERAINQMNDPIALKSLAVRTGITRVVPLEDAHLRNPAAFPSAAVLPQSNLIAQKSRHKSK